MFSALHECGHVTLWRTEKSAPDIGEAVWCVRCQRNTRVGEMFGPWRTQCRDCNRVNHHATLRTTVMRAAIAHAQEWSTHRVRVWQFGDPNSVVVLTAREVGVQPQLISDAPF